jgi:predicted PurR-regulated permease PerM
MLLVQLDAGLMALRDLGLDVDAYRDSIGSMFDPSSAVGIAAGAIKQTGSVLANGFMLMLTVVFILMEAVGMPRKLMRVVENPEETFKRFEAFLKSVKQYLAIKAVVSGVTGILAGVAVWVIGVDFAVLWGLLAFAFNFVPTVGSIIAAVPPVVLAAIQLGPGGASATLVCYVVINVVMGNIVEPRLTGEGLGLSALVVFLSLVFWGWLLGPVGMLLSVPLTMIVKIACESNPDTAYIGVILGPPVPKD